MSIHIGFTIVGNQDRNQTLEMNTSSTISTRKLKIEKSILALTSEMNNHFIKYEVDYAGGSLATASEHLTQIARIKTRIEEFEKALIQPEETAEHSSNHRENKVVDRIDTQALSNKDNHNSQIDRNSVRNSAGPVETRLNRQETTHTHLVQKKISTMNPVQSSSGTVDISNRPSHTSSSIQVEAPNNFVKHNTLQQRKAPDLTETYARTQARAPEKPVQHAATMQPIQRTTAKPLSECQLKSPKTTTVQKNIDLQAPKNPFSQQLGQLERPVHVTYQAAAASTTPQDPQAAAGLEQVKTSDIASLHQTWPVPKHTLNTGIGVMKLEEITRPRADDETELTPQMQLEVLGLLNTTKMREGENIERFYDRFHKVSSWGQLNLESLPISMLFAFNLNASFQEVGKMIRDALIIDNMCTTANLLRHLYMYQTELAEALRKAIAEQPELKRLLPGSGSKNSHKKKMKEPRYFCKQHGLNRTHATKTCFSKPSKSKASRDCRKCGARNWNKEHQCEGNKKGVHKSPACRKCGAPNWSREHKCKI